MSTCTQGLQIVKLIHSATAMASTATTAQISPNTKAKIGQSRESNTLDLLTALELHCSGKDSSGFGLLVKQLAANEVKEAQLKNWLVLFRENLHYLDLRCENLVMVLLRLDWCSLDAPAAREYSAFLLSLVSAHTYYLKGVLLMLMKNFLPSAEEIARMSQPSCSSQTQAEVARYARSHAVLRGICQLVPMAPALLVALASKCFPYMRHNVCVQERYVANLIELISYVPNQRQAILELIIDRLTKLDVYSPKHEIMEAKEMKRETSKNGDSQAVFEIEMEEDELKDRLARPQKLEHELANTLDTLMLLMFKFVRASCFSQESAGSGDLDWEASKKLFQELWIIFEKLILPTHDCCHVQFILFYLCSLKISLSEVFLDVLWKKVQNPNSASIIRQAAVAYIGSFVSRAVFVPISIVAAALDIMCHWIHLYISSQAECARSYVDITLHGPFYSVCQTVFYVFAFRHQELVDMDNGFEFLRRLAFDRIVTCRLNPLKVCLPVVVRNFAAVTRNYQLAYCYTIIEKNQRAVLPVVPYRGNVSDHVQVTSLNPLDSFFPFDPYLLTRSSEFITPLYREYRGVVEDESPSPEVEEDDFLADEEPANNSAPRSANSSFTEFFTYSLSPGFKHSFPT